ncbi:unnamed protein product [Soboliphyme baturini]|uniref:Protein Abitram n=1 Tax=Soboliphyme baturini TaxID=241478 RepID=A0A183J8K0_9BILA|nr:unnamed protein product [Soboliphyme baturini]
MMERSRFPVIPTLSSVVDRYYTRLYMCDVNGAFGEDQCVLVHSNHICLITIAPSHPVLRVPGRSVTSIDFSITDSFSRLDNKVSGKHKKGGQMLLPESTLCTVTCSDASVYVLRACVKGTLVEVNVELQTNPLLLQEYPETNGYVAIILPSCRNSLNFENLISREEYQKLRTVTEEKISKEEQRGGESEPAVSESLQDSETTNNPS